MALDGSPRCESGLPWRLVFYWLIFWTLVWLVVPQRSPGALIFGKTLTTNANCGLPMKISPVVYRTYHIVWAAFCISFQLIIFTARNKDSDTWQCDRDKWWSSNNSGNVIEISGEAPIIALVRCLRKCFLGLVSSILLCCYFSGFCLLWCPSLYNCVFYAVWTHDFFLSHRMKIKQPLVFFYLQTLASCRHPPPRPWPWLCRHKSQVTKSTAVSAQITRNIFFSMKGQR
jgi:hypothetical protein